MSFLDENDDENEELPPSHPYRPSYFLTVFDSPFHTLPDLLAPISTALRCDKERACRIASMLREDGHLLILGERASERIRMFRIFRSASLRTDFF